MHTAIRPFHLFILLLAALFCAQPAAAQVKDSPDAPMSDRHPMAMPLGLFLTELVPASPMSTVRIIREGQVLWEAESTPAGAELSPIMENFPRPGCRSLLVSSYSGGTHCCFREALVTSCDSREIFTSLNLAHSPVAMEQGETGWVIHTEDWSLAYYMLDDKRFLPPGIAEPTTRVLRFVPQEGWRPDKPGENPTFHHLFQSDLEDTPPDTSDPERAARAIAAAAHSFLASGSTVSARQTLAQLLPATWLPDLHTILGDIIDSVKSYTPCENTVFGP